MQSLEEKLKYFLLIEVLQHKETTSTVQTAGITPPKGRNGGLAPVKVTDEFSQHVGFNRSDSMLYKQDFDFDLFLKDIAADFAISRTSKFWAFDLLLQLLVEHPRFSEKKPLKNGRPQKDPRFKRRETREFFIQTMQLRALLMAQRDSEISDTSLAKAMVLRSRARKLDPNNHDILYDETIERSEYQTMLDKISRNKKMHRKLMESTKGKPLARVVKNPQVIYERQTETITFDWAPSDIELERYPRWRSIYKQLRESAMTDFPRPSL